MFCPQCGRDNRKKAKFCAECGWNLANKNINETVLLDKRYEVISIVKAGGMGCVYKAKDTRLGIVVAVKKMLAVEGTAEDRKYAKKKFTDEAILLSKLHHGGLPKVSDFFVENDPDTCAPAHYIVMTFIEGRDLDTVMKENKKKPLPVDEAVDFFYQTLEILSYLHSQNPPVIYRDMKPSNVMIQKGKVFLVDFGIAKSMMPQVKGTLIGTPGYASPEQYKGFTDEGSDLYSLGATIHYLLTGIDPENSANPPFQYDPIKNLNPAVPEFLDELIMSMVKFKREERPVSAEEVLEKLSEEYSPDKKTTSPVPTQQGKYSSRIMVKRKKHPAGSQKSLTNPIDVNKRDKDGMTGLHRAASTGDVKEASALISMGAKIDVPDNSRRTPLQWAAEKGWDKMVELLASNGAAINIKDDYGKTPLHNAASYGHLETVKVLLKKGADVETVGNFEETPLHWAAYQGHRDIAELLISHQSNINPKDKNGDTPLHHAVSFNHRETVEYLIKKGANKSIKNNNAKTPLNLAMEKGYGEIAGILKKAGYR